MNTAWFLLILHIALVIPSAGHALLYKRDSRASLGWIAVCLAYPIIGPLMYYLFGINRLRTRALQIKGNPLRQLKTKYERPDNISVNHKLGLPEKLATQPQLVALARSSAAVTHRPLVENNAVQPYFDGDNTYDAMLSAIAQAENSICLASYLFETDQTGKRFINALSAAQQRGIEVRVLLDGIGQLYNYPHASHLL